MITLRPLYIFTALLLTVATLITLRPSLQQGVRGLCRPVFFLLLSAIFLFGDYLPPAAVGGTVVALALLAALAPARSCPIEANSKEERRQMFRQIQDMEGCTARMPIR